MECGRSRNTFGGNTDALRSIGPMAGRDRLVRAGAGRTARGQVHAVQALGGTNVDGLMTAEPVVLHAAATLAVVAGQLRGTSRHTSYPVVDDGVVVGLFPLRAFVDTDPTEWGSHTVEQVLSPHVNCHALTFRNALILVDELPDVDQLAFDTALICASVTRVTVTVSPGDGAAVSTTE